MHADRETLGLLLFLVAIVGARLLGERAYRLLRDDEKARLVDGFSTLRILGTLLPLGALVVFVVAERNLHVERKALLVFVGALVAIVIGIAVASRRRLAQLGMPAAYVQQYTVAMAIRIAAIIFWIALLVSG